MSGNSLRGLMSEHLRKRLEEKKWAKTEIDKVLKVAEKARRSQSRTLNHATLILSLSVIILGNILVSIALIPPLLSLDGVFLYGVIALVGLSMGLFFEILTRSIDLDRQHHVAFSILMPSLALITVLVIVVYANALDFSLGIRNEHNPYWISLTYALAFLLPYLYYKFFLGKHYYSGE